MIVYTVVYLTILLVSKYKMTKSCTYTCTCCHPCIMRFAIHAYDRVLKRFLSSVGIQLQVAASWSSSLPPLASTDLRARSLCTVVRRLSRRTSICNIVHRGHTTHSAIGRAHGASLLPRKSLTSRCWALWCCSRWISLNFSTDLPAGDNISKDHIMSLSSIWICMCLMEK